MGKRTRGTHQIRSSYKKELDFNLVPKQIERCKANSFHILIELRKPDTLSSVICVKAGTNITPKQKHDVQVIPQLGRP